MGFSGQAIDRFGHRASADTGGRGIRTSTMTPENATCACGGVRRGKKDPVGGYSDDGAVVAAGNQQQADMLRAMDFTPAPASISTVSRR